MSNWVNVIALSHTDFFKQFLWLKRFLPILLLLLTEGFLFWNLYETIYKIRFRSKQIWSINRSYPFLTCLFRNNSKASTWSCVRWIVSRSTSSLLRTRRREILSCLPLWPRQLSDRYNRGAPCHVNMDESSLPSFSISIKAVPLVQLFRNDCCDVFPVIVIYTSSSLGIKVNVHKFINFTSCFFLRSYNTSIWCNGLQAYLARTIITE